LISLILFECIFFKNLWHHQNNLGSFASIGKWLCDSDLDNPTGIDRVLTEKYLLADSYLDLKASILDEKEFLLLKVISTLLELSCLICSMVGAGLGTDSVALSMTHFSGRIFSS